MIELAELEEQDIEDILAMLEEEDEETCTISLSKTTQQFFSDSTDIANEYGEAAYVGQILSDVSSEFNYEFVSPPDDGSFDFQIKTDDKKKLAEVILELSYAYSNESEDKEYVFAEDVEQFLDDVKSNKIKAACPDFIEVYHKFMESADENQDDDDED